MEAMTNNWSVADARNYGVRSSVPVGAGKLKVPSGASRSISYGDKIFVRAVNVQRGWEQVADFVLDTVADLTEVFCELRHRAGKARGLIRVYVRNATRGWSFEQPFKLYGDAIPVRSSASATAATTSRMGAMRPGILFQEAETSAPARRGIPESVRMLYSH